MWIYKFGYFSISRLLWWIITLVVFIARSLYIYFRNLKDQFYHILNYHLDTSCTCKSTSAQTSHKNAKLSICRAYPPNLKLCEDPQDLVQSHWNFHTLLIIYRDNFPSPLYICTPKKVFSLHPTVHIIFITFDKHSPDLGRDTCLAPEGFKRLFNGPRPEKFVHHWYIYI